MKFLARSTNQPTSLGRDYLVLSLIILLILFLFCSFTGLQLYKSEQKTRLVTLYSKLYMVRDRFHNSLDNVNSYMQFMGDRVLGLPKQNSATLSNLFQNSFSLDSNLRNFYSWTLLNWIDTNNQIVITAQEGYLKKPLPLPSFYPLEEAKKQPWQLQLGMVHLTKEGYKIIPATMAIENDEDKYQGSVISNILVEKIERDLYDALKEENIAYVIIDANSHIVISSIPLDAKISTESLELDTRSENNVLLSPIILGDTTFELISYSSYPFTILIGYNNSEARQQFRRELFPYLYLASAITCCFLFILFVFRRRVVIPVIDQLKDTLASETAVRIEKERMLTHILNRVPGFIYRHQISDHTIQALFVSEGCQKLTGYSVDQYCGKSHLKHTDLIQAAYIPKIVATIKRAFIDHKPFEISYPITTATGEIKWVLNQGVPVENGSETQIFEGLLTDITDIKQSERVMEKMVKELALSNEELKRFAYVCSHDLKEPLRTIFSYIELFKEENKHCNFNELSREYLEFIETGALRMNKLIEDILLYSQIGAQPMQQAHFNIITLINEVTRSLGTIIQETRANIVISSDVSNVYANYNQVSRLFQNIISNALKFRGERTPEITIEISKDGNHCLVAIKDNGIGIPKESFDRVFHLFERLHTKDEYPGSGLGLALCHKIIERHGGRIWVTSTVEVGSTFYFTLPLVDNITLRTPGSS